MLVFRANFPWVILASAWVKAQNRRKNQLYSMSPSFSRALATWDMS